MHILILLNEMGTSEKQNLLVRRLFPKGKFFDLVTDDQTNFAKHWLNNYRSADFIF